MDNNIGAENESIVFHWDFLREASKKLHGYFLHRYFNAYLNLLAENMHRLIMLGQLEPDGQPSKETDYRSLFDLDALDSEKLTYFIGLYYFILSSHKKANYFLIQENKTKRVLYLRGYDYEGATRTGGGQAMGYSSVDTARFTHQLAEHLRPDAEIFTVLSPKDLYWDTVGPQRYFYAQYDSLRQACSEPIRSVYLNANFWQADIAELVDRVDYFVVYVSSITPSALWEIDLLKIKKRTAQTTIVFDEEAIANKEIQYGMQEKMEERYGDDVIWSKNRIGTETLTPAELRDELGKNFLVVSKDDFLSNIKQHKARIKKVRAKAGDESRYKPLPFRFSPAVEAGALKQIENFDNSVGAIIHRQISAKTITNLPWFVNAVQLKIYTSVMLGKHDETGKALAVYGAVMESILKELSDVTDDAWTEDQKQSAREKLEAHAGVGHYASIWLLKDRNTDDFYDYSANAAQVSHELSVAATAAVESFCENFPRPRRKVGKTRRKPRKKTTLKD